MSRLFGDVRQLGYVVPDIHAAMRHWAEVLGIGPWFYTGCNQIENGVINGKDAPFSVKIAIANSGDMQIELIEPVEGPTPYHDFWMRRTAWVGCSTYRHGRRKRAWKRLWGPLSEKAVTLSSEGKWRARNLFIWTQWLNKAPCLKSPLCQSSPSDFSNV